MITIEHPLSELINMYTKLAGMYDAGSESLSAQISNNVTRENILKYVTRLGINKVLDAGGGTGNWSIFLAQHGFEVTLLDINPELLKTAKQKIEEEDLSIHIVEGNIEESVFEDHAFDLVIAEGGVISLTPNPEKMMQELRRITRAGGYVWIDYLNLLGWTLLQPDVERKVNLAGREEELIYMGKNNWPFRLFSPKKIRYMLYDAGFLELNEFGNGVITNPMMEDLDFNPEDLDRIIKTEISLSRNHSLIGTAFHVEVLAQKIIH